jgi:tetratricopeptide (TPR) repeat protein
VPLRLLGLRDAEERGELWQAAAGYRTLWHELGAVPTFGAGLARVAETLGAHALAACAARAVVALRPEDGAAWYLLGVAEAGRGSRAAALEAFDRALQNGFDAARVEVQRGELLFDAMRIDAALTSYRRAVELDPEAAEVIRPFALAALTADQQQDLAGLLELHLASHPDNADTLYALATLDLAAGRLGVAEARLRRLAAIAPGHLQLHYNLGQLYLRQGRTEAGHEELGRFAALRAAADRDWERHNEAHRRRLAAEAARQGGDREAEIALLEENVRQATDELADRRALAVAYLAAGRAEEARRAAQAVLVQLPGDEIALLAWNEAAALQGQHEEAAEAAARLSLLRHGCAGLEGAQPAGVAPARRGD